jgi:outer membrane phospholipase A
MKLYEIIEIIYPTLIDKLDLSQDVQKFEVCQQLDENYTYFVKVYFNSHFLFEKFEVEMDISDKNEKSMDCDIYVVRGILTQKLNLYYDYQKSISHEP